MDDKELLEQIKKLKEALDGRLGGVATQLEAIVKSQTLHDETIKKLGVITGDATLAEQVNADRKRVNDLVESVGQFTRQMPNLGDGHTERDPEYVGFWPSEKRAEQFGLFCLGGLHTDPSMRRRCAEAVTKAGLTLRAKDGAIAGNDDYVKAMGESQDTLGGYLVPDEFMATIIRHVNTYGVARQFLKNVPMSAERQSWPKRTGGLTVYYPDEGVAPTASDLAFGRVTLNAKKWAVLTHFSRELEEDAAAPIGELIAKDIALALAIAEDTNAFMGDGTSTYAGITGVFGSSNVAVVTMGSGDTTFAKAAWGDLVDMINAVPAWALTQPDCAWYMSPSIKGVLMKIVESTTGRPLLTDPNRDGFNQLIGYPVRVSNVLPGIADEAVSTKFLAFGSMSAWGMLGQRRGMILQRSTEVKFLEGQTTIMAVPRQDIQEAEGTAMATLRTAAS